MKLNLYRRHRPGCEAGREPDSRSSELEERRKGWGRKCECQIHVSGTLDGRFSRKATGASTWEEAHSIARAYELAGSWTGEPKLAPIVPEPAANPPKAGVMIEDACNVFITNREAAA